MFTFLQPLNRIPKYQGKFPNLSMPGKPKMKFPTFFSPNFQPHVNPMRMERTFRCLILYKCVMNVLSLSLFVRFTYANVLYWIVRFYY